MTIPPRFLDELRNRLNVSDIVGKRVRLTRAGREYKGCCPFHNEKTASFYVNDDKQFFHCFGCGAHGTVIDFVMRHDNLSFPEAVDALAQQAGMQVPRSSPEDIEKAKREKSLYTLLDDASRWMEAQLRDPANRAAYDYVRGRNVGEDVMDSFRIGYAPNDMQALRRNLLDKGYTDAQMIEAGLLKTSEKSREPYAFFRERVMFPVTDRRGRIVAFGGRVLPDHLRAPARGDFTPPKYINSADTPLFHKGKMLFAEAHARQAAADGQRLIVVEGYLDVIACWKAGFKGAVAPLGTALTEDQIVVLWKIIPGDSKVPVLCFDGDNAGRRAASRACERILPLLKPGHSARIAFLPEGEDPDSLIMGAGAAAFENVLETASSLVDFLYKEAVEGRDLSTPEERAGLSSALESLAARIADRTVQHYYREAFRAKTKKAFATSESAAPSSAARGGYTGSKWQGRSFRQPELPPISRLKRPDFGRSALYNAALLACVINNPEIFDEVEESLGRLDFKENIALRKLRQATTSILSHDGPLDSGALHAHLCKQGFGDTLEKLLSDTTYTHAAFARPSLDSNAALVAWRQAWQAIQAERARDDLNSAKRALIDNPCEENENRLNALREMRASTEG